MSIKDLRTVPLYRQRQAEIILIARFKARKQIANKEKVSPRDVMFFGEHA